MAKGLWPSAWRARWAGLVLAPVALVTAQAQESGVSRPDTGLAGDGLHLRLTHAPTRPAIVQRRLDGVVAATLAVTAPRRPVSLDGAASDSAPPVKPAAWHSGLGLTLSGGDRIGVRRADGGLQLVWRRQF